MRFGRHGCVRRVTLSVHHELAARRGYLSKGSHRGWRRHPPMARRPHSADPGASAPVGCGRGARPSDALASRGALDRGAHGGRGHRPTDAPRCRRGIGRRVYALDRGAHRAICRPSRTQVLPTRTGSPVVMLGMRPTDRQGTGVLFAAYGGRNPIGGAASCSSRSSSASRSSRRTTPRMAATCVLVRACSDFIASTSARVRACSARSASTAARRVAIAAPAAPASTATASSAAVESRTGATSLTLRCGGAAPDPARPGWGSRRLPRW